MPNSTVSLISLTEGSGGHMKVFWAMNSLSMSFWIVPPILVSGMPLISAAAQYMAQRAVAGGLMVMEVVTLSIGMPSIKLHEIIQGVDGDAALAAFAARLGRVGVIAHQGRKIEGGAETRLPFLQEHMPAFVGVLASPMPENIRKVQYLPR